MYLGCTGEFLSKLVGNNPTKSKEKLFWKKETALLLSKNISQAHNQPYKILMIWNLNLSEWKLARVLCFKGLLQIKQEKILSEFSKKSTP